jgi:hypothetical protein
MPIVYISAVSGADNPKVACLQLDRHEKLTIMNDNYYVLRMYLVDMTISLPSRVSRRFLVYPRLSSSGVYETRHRDDLMVC